MAETYAQAPFATGARGDRTEELLSQQIDPKKQRREAAERREAEERKAARRGNLITTAVGVAIAALVVALVVSDRREKTVVASDFGAAAEEACEEAQEIEDQGAEHVDDGTIVDSYNSSPGTSGPHWQSPASAGFYPQPLEQSQLVHNLEHGQIVIYYSPDLDDESVDFLEAYTDAGQGAVIATPSTDLNEPVVLAAWTRLQECSEASSAAIDSFRERFQGKAPEQITPPFSAD